MVQQTFRALARLFLLPACIGGQQQHPRPHQVPEKPILHDIKTPDIQFLMVAVGILYCNEKKMQRSTIAGGEQERWVPAVVGLVQRRTLQRAVVNIFARPKRNLQHWAYPGAILRRRAHRGRHNQVRKAVALLVGWLSP